MISRKYLLFFYLVLIIGKNSYCEDLDFFAIKYGTDKSSKHHNYTEIYEEYFSDLRHKEITLLEIGLGESYSALMWEAYFTKANFYFVDRRSHYIEKGERILSERSKCLLCDQGSRKSLIDFMNKVGVEFDIIIDDGGHVSKNQILSFETLFPYVKSGGIYVIEDLNNAYWKGAGGYGDKKNPKDGPGSAIWYLKNLVDEVNFVAATHDDCANINYYPKNKRDKLNYYQENIKSIHFYSSLCFVLKR